jgi:nitronate monooxygenase
LNESPEGAQKALTYVLDRGVKAIWLSFGDNLSSWVEHVRQHSGPNKPLIVILVSTVEEAGFALEECKADIIVAQGTSINLLTDPEYNRSNPGNESGGHGLGASSPLTTLLPLITQKYPHAIVLAAGGLATGAHLASMLALGAEGAVFGTRFLVSEESLYSAEQKKAVRDAKGPRATIRTTAFDEVNDTSRVLHYDPLLFHMLILNLQVRGSLGWPSGIDGRGLANQIVSDQLDGQLSLEERKRRYQIGTQQKDANSMVVWAGTGVDMVNDNKPARVRSRHSQLTWSVTEFGLIRPSLWNYITKPLKT